MYKAAIGVDWECLTSCSLFSTYLNLIVFYRPGCDPGVHCDSLIDVSWFESTSSAEPAPLESRSHSFLSKWESINRWFLKKNHRSALDYTSAFDIISHKRMRLPPGRLFYFYFFEKSLEVCVQQALLRLLIRHDIDIHFTCQIKAVLRQWQLNKRALSEYIMASLRWRFCSRRRCASHCGCSTFEAVSWHFVLGKGQREVAVRN